MKKVGNIEIHHYEPLQYNSTITVMMHYNESVKKEFDLRGIEDVRDLIYSLQTIERKMEKESAATIIIMVKDQFFNHFMCL